MDALLSVAAGLFGLYVLLSWLLGRVGGFLWVVLPAIVISTDRALSNAGGEWTPAVFLLGPTIGLGVALIPGFVRVMIEEYLASEWRQSRARRRWFKQVTAFIAEENRSRNSRAYRAGRRCAEWCQRIAAENRLRGPAGS